MSESTSPPRSWPRALTLAERAALLPPVAAATGAPDADEQTRFRLAQWRALSPFAADEGWRRRLASQGLDEGSLARLLATPAARLASGMPPPPEWRSAFDLEPAGGEPPFDPAAGAPAGFGLLALARPQIAAARRQVRRGLDRIVAEAGEACPFTAEGALALASAALPFRLLPLLSRTLVLELHVARLEGLLGGATPEERFAAFAARLAEPEVARALWEEYPVLARQVAIDLAFWSEATLELCGRLAADWPLLVATFFGGRDPGPLSAVDGGAGDRHRRGRTVRLLAFAAGARLVYKPRPMAVDAHFQEVLAWLNRRGDHPPWRTLAVLDRGEYGWMEFVAAAPCAEPADVARFHRRLGGLLALLYALEATDCHFENLIAAADQPVVVDLESLFHPAGLREAAAQAGAASRTIGGSVLRVGLLPFQVGQSDEFAGIDLSGVAEVAGQPTPQKVLQWADVGTDAMRVVRDRATMEGGQNRPMLDGRAVDAADFLAEMAAGFADTYRLLAHHRGELLAPGGPIAACATDPVRAVLRPTQLYGLLLMESLHPDLLRDALDRDIVFDRLWIGVEGQPGLAPVVPAELRDLAEGDIPAFFTDPSSTDLLTSRGERLADFFAEPSLAAVRRRLTGFGEEDLRFQLWLLLLSLGAQRLNRDDVGWQRYAPVADAEPWSPAELAARALAAAGRVGEWFGALAVRDGGYVTWIGLDYRNQRWSLEPATEDLYTGLPGIALFLAFLGERAGSPEATALARAAVRTLKLQLELGPDGLPGESRLTSIGAFQGWAGVIWAFAHLGALWRDGELLAAARPWVERIAEGIDGDRELDLVGGAAGAILGLLALARATGEERPLAVARACGEHLLRVAIPVGTGLGWLTLLATETPQIGMSHGAAGIALALVRLGAATGDPRFTAAGLAGFAWERQAFWPELARWTAEATDGPPPLESTVAMAWCYGAPGVGLSRLLALPEVAAPAARQELRAEVEQAVAKTLERGFGQNHSLCHGDLGNLDFLLQAHQALGGDALAAGIRRHAQNILASIERDGWLCGTRGSVEAPALMNGLAGIGYGLLRLADPAGVPSVLALAAPLLS